VSPEIFHPPRLPLPSPTPSLPQTVKPSLSSTVPLPSVASPVAHRRHRPHPHAQTLNRRPSGPCAQLLRVLRLASLAECRLRLRAPESLHPPSTIARRGVARLSSARLPSRQPPPCPVQCPLSSLLTQPSQ